jgi:hypothetical protein
MVDIRLESVYTVSIRQNQTKSRETMKTTVIILNIAIVASMAMIYINHVHAAEIEHLRMLIQIEKTVGQALFH